MNIADLEDVEKYKLKCEKLFNNVKTFQDIDFVISELKKVIEENRKHKDIHFTEYHQAWREAFFSGLINYFSNLKGQE